MTVGRMLALAALGALSACSLVLDTSEFRTGRRELRLDGIEPIQVVEGALVPVIVRGQGLDDSVNVSAVVALPGGSEVSVAIADRLESRDGSELGLLLAVPRLPGHDPEPDPMENTASVRIELQRGETHLERSIALRALRELELDADELRQTDKLDELYSEIRIDATVLVRGLQPARLVATSAIRINGILDASGGNPTGPEPGTGGPGGCDGGAGGATDAAGTDGGCDRGGGRGGVAATGEAGPGGGGGGGGCAVAGGESDGSAGGAAVCSDVLVPLGAPSNRGHGGGGGGGSGREDGGGGGGGGGVIVLDAPLVALNGQVTALGGNGAPGDDSECADLTVGGGGGGGSGGVVLVRADTLVVTERDRISVRGGLGASTCPGIDSGGDGAPGRVRVDIDTLQSSTIDDLTEIADLFSRNLWRGPRLAVSTPRLIRRGEIDIQVRGDPAQTYGLRVDLGEPVAIVGEQTLKLALERGLREVCVLVQDEDPELPESQHCLTIAVLAP